MTRGIQRAPDGTSQRTAYAMPAVAPTVANTAAVDAANASQTSARATALFIHAARSIRTAAGSKPMPR